MNKHQCKTKSKAVVAEALSASAETGAGPGAVAGVAVRYAAVYAVVTSKLSANCINSAFGFGRLVRFATVITSP